MKFNSFRLLFFFSIIVLLSSCLGTNDTTTPSKDPSFLSLKFAKNDSIPNINTAAFTLQYDATLNDSVIVNLDSLPYKTRIDSVYPTFSFKSSSAAYLIDGNDSVRITGTDTIDFSKSLKVRNIASDQKTNRVYSIKVNVHQVEPELYVWNKLSDDIDTHNATSQKAIVYNDTIFYYLNNTTSGYLYKSINGTDWADQTTNIPADTKLNDMQLFNGKLFLTQAGDKIYTSSDRRNWTVKTNADYNFKSLLFNFNSKLWAVVQSKTDLSYRLATTTDGDLWVIKGEIPTNFPVRDFSSLTYSSRTGKQKVLVVGGYSANNTLLKTSWSSEDGSYWLDFSTENKTLDTLAVGASVIAYDKKLLVFGKGLNKKGLEVSYIRQSLDEGLSWQMPDTLLNRLPLNFDVRSYQSVVVYKPRTYNSTDSKSQNLESNRIFVLGGNSTNGVKSDVWTGKLNRKNFMLQ